MLLNKQVMNKRNKIMLVQAEAKGFNLNRIQLPVGLGYLARALEISGIEYEVVDLNTETESELFYKIIRSQPNFLGIRMMTYSCRRTYRLLSKIKKLFPDLKIIAGGPHVTANREKVLLECPAIDIGVKGEGESAIVELMYSNTLETIKGVLYRKGQKVCFSGERGPVESLDNIPFPTYRGFRLRSYGRHIHLYSSRGCPYKCVFCSNPKVGGAGWRKRNPQHMIEEIEYWYKKGYRYFTFIDDNFAIDKIRILDFCEEVIKRKLKVALGVHSMRVDRVDEGLLRKMRQAGFAALSFGVESSSDKVLQNLKKGQTLQQIEYAIEKSTDLGFWVELIFLIGSPGEKVEDVERSFQLAQKYRIACASFYKLFPVSGTELYDWAVEKGYKDIFKGGYPVGRPYHWIFMILFRNLLWSDTMTPLQVFRLVGKASIIAQQIRSRYYLSKAFQGLTGKDMRGDNFLSNLLSCRIICYLVDLVVVVFGLGVFRLIMKLAAFSKGLFLSIVYSSPILQQKFFRSNKKFTTKELEELKPTLKQIYDP